MLICNSVCMLVRMLIAFLGQVLELREERDAVKLRLDEAESRLREDAGEREALQRDLDHERQWREEWNLVHDQVASAFASCSSSFCSSCSCSSCSCLVSSPSATSAVSPSPARSRRLDSGR